MNLPSASAHPGAALGERQRAQRSQATPSVAWAAPGSAASSPASASAPAQAAPLPSAWPWQQEFLRELSKEVRRTERAGTPVSLVLYRFRAEQAEAAQAAANWHEQLRGQVRETDFVGQPDAHTLAVLCPDTDAQGLQALLRKLGPLQNTPVEVSSATYPDDLFTSLAAGLRPAASVSPFLVTDHGPEDGMSYPLKRPLDLLGACLALLLFAPLMAVVALIIATTSRGPVIFRQQRLGQGGVPFTFYKFRSMRTDSGDAIHRQYVARLIAAGDAGAAPTAAADSSAPASPFKLADDPRITRIGRFIRRTSIDELPQLFNVIKGDMSLVGPRPPLAYEASAYRPWHLRRLHALRPGITGLWQVEGRSRVPFNDMVRMDLRYGRECSLGLDLRILIKTVGVVLGCRGAV